MFDDYADMIARDYFDIIKYYGLSIDFCDIDTTQKEKKFKNFCLATSKINLLNEKDIHFVEMTRNECIDLACSQMSKITSINIEKFQQIKNIVRKTNKGQYFDGINLCIVNPVTNEMARTIEVPYLDKSISSVCLAHEIIHYFVEQNKQKILQNDHYTEFLPIFYEFVFSGVLEEECIERKMSMKQQIVRLDSIKFHAEELGLVDSIRKMQYQSLDEQIKKRVEFGEHLSYSYLISYLYANYLYSLYLNSPELIHKINNVLIGENNVPNLLNYAGINLANTEVFVNAYGKINNISKVKKI